MNETSHKKLLSFFVAGVLVGAGVWWVLSLGRLAGTSALPDIITTAPAFSAAELSGTAPISAEQEKMAAAYRSALVQRARASTPLTEGERSVLATALLTGAALYHFSADEVALLNGALSR